MGVPEGITLMHTAGGQNSAVKDEDKKTLISHKGWLQTLNLPFGVGLKRIFNASERRQINGTPNAAVDCRWIVFGAKRKARVSWKKRKD